MTGGKSGMAFVAGLFFGTLVGAASAALMAPASGRELRGSIRKEAKKLAVKARELVPEQWSDIAREELTREIVDNIQSLRSAGL